MSDYFSAITPNTDLTVADFDGRGPGTSTDLATGDLRRKYNFGQRVSELSIAQDPFFRFLSKVSKKNVDDPQFKWAEKRDSWHKRYAYPIAVSHDGATYATDGQLDGDLAAKLESTGNDIWFLMATDYKNQGNIQNVYNNTTDEIKIGGADTMPKFFMPDQLVKINLSSATQGDATDYAIVKVTTVTDQTGSSSYNSVSTVDGVYLKCNVVKAANSTSSDYLAKVDDWHDAESVTASTVHDTLEPARAYVVGSAHAEGTGYPETWKDQPYSTNIGLTQIWKTSMAMTNTARATVLKFEPNEWARVWKQKLVEHKWDIEQSLLFGSQGTVGDTQYTQGAVDYITNYGNAFSLSTATKTADDFLDDMSSYLDPRYNNSSATLYFVNTAVYNWMHKLGGYFKNNLEISSNFRADFAMTGKKNIKGVSITTFTTPYGDMNVARNIHLDGTNVKMLGINMKYATYRPLVGNGVDRDTSIYVGVQTLENSGVDRRVDLILTEAGMEWSMPECHAIWT
jgi:hypothetical protein